MDALISLLQESGEYRELRESVKRKEAAAVSGLSPVLSAHFIAALSRDLGLPFVAICRDEEAAQALQESLRDFLEEEPSLLPGRDLNFYEAGAMSRGWEQKRLRTFYGLLTGEVRSLVASVSAVTLRTMPPETLRESALLLKIGERYDISALAEKLTALGYSRCSLVEGVGQFALRGGILDVFSPASELPLRVEFFDDEVDTMGFFDPSSQRRVQNVESLLLLPVAEALPGLHSAGRSGLAEALKERIARQNRRKTPLEALIKTLKADLERLEGGLNSAAWDRYLALIYKDFSTAADYFPADALVFYCDHGNLQNTAKGLEDDFALDLKALMEDGFLDGELCSFRKSWEEFSAAFSGKAVLYLDSFLGARYPECRPPKEMFAISAKQLPSYGGNLETAILDLEHYQKHGFRTLVLCGSRHRAEILGSLLEDRGISASLRIPLSELPPEGRIYLTAGSLPAGLEYPNLKFAVLTEGQLAALPQKRRKPAKKQVTNRKKLSAFTDLTPGDLVVHEYHGIGRYVCMEQIRVDGVIKDYVKIAYQGTDTLYVPATQLDLISKYIGGGEDSPVKLNKLGTDTWQKTKTRAKKAVKELAEDLIRLYAERKRLPGYAFSEDSPWQQEFEEGFEYAETEDQLRCIGEIKEDMERPQPMDRLLCGDVGFGKTEVALRAAMKAVLDGKQVAILVPTTVLAQQHYSTAIRRFRGFPVNIDVLSRFRTPNQQRATLSRLAGGHVDLIIGTHKLLQKDIAFKDLGLLIVDEEQRFGVSHKERLKELSKGVDVLTLSATPIPRTLNMALSGIRDMSTIEEPPQDRYPVQTYVLEYAEHVILDAISRELERGGQVYYLHNRVESIEQTAAKLKQAFPSAELAVAHGKMNEEQLSDVMQRMADGEIRILVCTTIIETGIDIPNVNTLIIEDADRMGLSQLHQIRGRVGRSSRHAYAYLTYRRGKVLTEVAEKRLTAIRDYAEFGSGFKIAMRDLEIRGAGNLLGAEQSGHMMSVGYDLYLKLLEDAVLEEQNAAPKKQDCAADLTVEANISKKYVENGEQRMDLYRRIAAIRNKADADDLTDELLDRYGDLPIGARNLIAVALLRADAVECGIRDITQKGEELKLTLSSLDFSAVSALCTAPNLKGRIRFSAGQEPALTLRLRKGEDPLSAAQSFVRDYRGMIHADQLVSASDPEK